MNIAVFVSGRGSNLNAVINSNELKDLIEIRAVFSDKFDCPAFEIAKRNSIKTFCLGSKENCIGYEQLTNQLKSLKIELIVLAGFLKLIPREIVREYKNRIINIHPALLPSFGGKGMYGIHVHESVFKSSAQVSGATVHFIDEEYDKGFIIAQRCVDISNVNSPDEIAERVLEVEHALLPFVIRKFAEGKISIREGRVLIQD